MRSKRLRHVIQVNLTSGCGPACVAIVARTSYSEAVKAMFGDRAVCRSKYPKLKIALTQLKVRHASRAKRVTTWTKIDSTSIVACGKRRNKHGEVEWHWVVYEPSSDIVYDPLKARPVARRAIRRRPFSYLAVGPK